MIPEVTGKYMRKVLRLPAADGRPGMAVRTPGARGGDRAGLGAARRPCVGRASQSGGARVGLRTTMAAPHRRFRPRRPDRASDGRITQHVAQCRSTGRSSLRDGRRGRSPMAKSAAGREFEQPGGSARSDQARRWPSMGRRGAYVLDRVDARHGLQQPERIGVTRGDCRGRSAEPDLHDACRRT